MSQDLTIRRPEGALADLMPAKHIADTMAVLQGAMIDENPSAPQISRLPTAQERGRLHERKTQLRVLTQAATDRGIAAREHVARVVGMMIGGWLNVKGDPQEIISGWTAKLVELPDWAVAQACNDFTERRAELPDEKGKPRRITGEYAPSLAQVYALARSKLDTLFAEAELIDRLMRARLAAPPEDPAEVERMAVAMRELASNLGAKHEQHRVAAEREAKANLAAAKGRAAQFKREADQRRLERYAELGLKPVYVGDRLCDADALPNNLRQNLGDYSDVR